MAKPGAAQLAKLVGMSVGAFDLRPTRAWRLSTWDGFLIPKPFSRVVVTWPRVVPAGAVTVEAVQAVLDRAVAKAAKA